MKKGTAIVTGSSSGLGLLLAAEMRIRGYHVFEYDLTAGHDVTRPEGVRFPSEVSALINCAGVNRINWLQDVTAEEWDLVMGANAKGILRMTQAVLPQLRASKGTVVNIVSNAAHMPMRCSAAYNASKGAALILTKQLARELAPDVTVFSVSPNKLEGTGMSRDIDQQVVETRGWTPEEATEYQLKGLLTGEETPPYRVAEFIGFLLSRKERHKYLTGCDIPYGA